MGLAGLVAVGLLSLQVGTASADNGLAKRDEDTPDVVMVNDDDDDDDDDTGNTRTRTGSSINRDKSGVSNDDTNSRRTAVSRDRDRSRGDKTTDKTNDGPGRKNIDHSKNKTNDRSRNDTRR